MGKATNKVNAFGETALGLAFYNFFLVSDQLFPFAAAVLVISETTQRALSTNHAGADVRQNTKQHPRAPKQRIIL